MPFKDKMDIHRCLGKIISLMPPKYKKFITSIKYKGEVLYIRVSHPAIRQELYYKKDEIFSIIKMMHNHGICKEIKPKKLYTDYQYKKIEIPKEIKFYVQNAKHFENKAKNPEIKKLFEELRGCFK